MEPIARRNFSLFLLVIATMVVIVLKPSCCEASGTISQKSIKVTSTPSMICERPMEECLIGRLDDELEFQMPSEISRRTLISFDKDKLTKRANNNPKESVLCGRDQKYRYCGPDKNPPRNKENCNNKYKRAGCL